MESYALGVSPPLALCTQFHHLKKKCCLKQQQEYCFQKSIRRSSTSRLNELLPLPFYRKSSSRHLQFKGAASSVPENANADSDSDSDSDGFKAAAEKPIIHIVKLGAMFGTWYLLNIYYNILNKQLLKLYPFPATITAFQLGCGTLLVFLMWIFNLHPKPNIRTSQFAAIFSLAALHTLGNLLTNISLGKVAVSFTHTIKSMEPFFTVLLSASLLGVRPSLWVVLSLVPIVGGVALASFTEPSFNWIGFATAMASNLTNQSRNVFSKKLLMLKEEEALDNINLFSVITIISFILLTPIAILMEGVRFTPSNLHYVASQGFNTRDLWVRFLLAGFCFHSYQQVSYMILEMVSPVSHAVGNCVKRVVVIVSSVVFFQTPVSPINFLGTTIALAGVFFYSRVKRLKPKVA